MRTIPASIATLGIVGALGLCGCSADVGSSRSGPGSSAGRGITAACAVDDSVSAPTAVPSTGKGGRGHGSVGVVLQQTPGQAPTAQRDARLIAKALEGRGEAAETATPGSGSALISRSKRMIDRGVKVLVLDAADRAAGVHVERYAERASVDVIDYDHLTAGGSAPYYVSFDEEAVGRLQAQAMVDCLAQQGITDPRVIIMDGGTDVDPGAVLLDKGVHEVLDPLVAAGRATILEEATAEGWGTADAEPAFKTALQASGGQVDAVLAANDGIADAVVGVLADEGLDGKVFVAGTGSGIQGLRNIVAGRQSVTVFEDPREEAATAAALASALVDGRSPAAAGLTTVPFVDPRSANRRLEAVLLPAQVVTRADVRDLVGAVHLRSADICAGLASPCAALGLD